MKEMRAAVDKRRLTRRSQPGLALVAVRADLGDTVGLSHHSDDVGCARARLAGSRGTTLSIIQ